MTSNRKASAAIAERAADGGTVVDVLGLYQAQWRPMVRLAVLLVDDVPSAEDAVQEAFLSLYRQQSGLRSPDRASAYLRSAVVNQCRSTLRRRVVARRKVALVAVAADATTTDAIDQVSDAAPVMTALRALPRRMREVVVLRYWAGLTEAETATTLGISPGTVKSAASRGLAKLRQSLGGPR